MAASWPNHYYCAAVGFYGMEAPQAVHLCLEHSCRVTACTTYSKLSWRSVQNAAVHDQRCHVRRRENEELIARLSVPAPGTKPLAFPHAFPQSQARQLWLLLKKNSLTYWRSPNYNTVRFAFTIALGGRRFLLHLACVLGIDGCKAAQRAPVLITGYHAAVCCLYCMPFSIHQSWKQACSRGTRKTEKTTGEHACMLRDFWLHLRRPHHWCNVLATRVTQVIATSGHLLSSVASNQQLA